MILHNCIFFYIGPTFTKYMHYIVSPRINMHALISENLLF